MRFLKTKSFGPQTSDEVLLKALWAGDDKAFQAFVEKYWQMVSRVALFIVKDSHHVEDLCQEIFLKAFQNIKKFRGDSALKSWLYRITINESLRFMRQNKPWGTKKELDSESSISNILVLGHEETPERILLHGEKRQQLYEALGTLKDHHKIILTLFYLEGVGIKDLADILNIPEGSVKSRLFYARESLKKAIQPVLQKVRPQHLSSSPKKSYEL